MRSVLRALGRPRCAGFVAVLVGVGTALSACAYRPTSPAVLGESLRLVTAGKSLRLPRAASLVQERAATAIVRDLGWQVTPSGSAVLTLLIDSEDVRTTARDRDDLPQRWNIRLHARAVLSSHLGTRSALFTGNANTSGLDDEDQALTQAADALASALTSWLAGVAAAPSAPAPVSSPMSASASVSAPATP